MQRDVSRLAKEHFDVVIIGAGVHGATAAMEAAQRGLSVAIIEQNDFCSATSHNSLKIVHGGIRYLQHLDFRRVRQSIEERRFWLRVAPHMVAPLDFWMPTRGWGTRGAAALWAAMQLYGLIGWDRNTGIASDRLLPRGQLRGRATVRKGLGGLWGASPPTAAVWWDGQMLDADRLVLECLLAADESGAAVSNYVQADGIERTRDGSVIGVRATDKIGESDFVIRAKNVVVAAGPWTVPFVQPFDRANHNSANGGLVRNMNVVVRRRWTDVAVGIESSQRSDAVVGKSNRLFFMTPWRECSVFGTLHEPYEGVADDYAVTANDVAEFVEEVSRSCPSLGLSAEDVIYVYAGLTPADEAGGSARARSSGVIDHGRQGAATGLYSIVGVKYTTARALAEELISIIGQKHGGVSHSISSASPLPGARGFSTMNALRADIREGGVHGDVDVDDLAIAYGTQFRSVVSSVDGELSTANILKARVVNAIRNEMALRLDDIALRRIDWAPRGRLDDTAVACIADAAADELGWDQPKKASEIVRLKKLAGGPTMAAN